MELQKILEHGERYFLSNLSIDLVIIGYKNGKLKCLLLKLGNKWVLPGGYIKIKESTDDAVTRILEERTRLKNPHFKFLDVFGNKDRKFTEEFKAFFDKKKLPWREDYWINNRFVTMAYYSLVAIDDTDSKPGDFDEAAHWFSFDNLPDIGLDHGAILDTARTRLKEDIQREQLTYNLMPNEFTMPQLHSLHQTILMKSLDRSRFQKKILASGMFKRLPKVKKETPGSNPYQYSLK
jgi:ADP-ribose pyrophosphatase YjhB (NUDIX family)